MPQKIEVSEMTHENGFDIGYQIKMVDDRSGDIVTEVNIFPYENAGMADVIVYEHLFEQFRMTFASYGSREHEQAYFNRSEAPRKKFTHGNCKKIGICLCDG